MLTIFKKRHFQILTIFLVGLSVGLSFGLTCFFKIPELCTDPDGLSIPAKIFAKTFGFGSCITRGPVYPFLLGIVYYLFGLENQMAIIIFQTICFALIGTFVYSISLKSFSNKKVATLSALATFLNPVILWYIPKIWVEIPFTLFILIMLNAAYKSIKKPSVKNLVLFGFTTALSALCKAVTLLFPLFLGISLLICTFFKYTLIKHFSKRDLVKFILIPTVFMLITLSPWTIRNKIVSGKFLLVSSGIGVEFFRGTVFADENSFLLQQTIPQTFKNAKIKEKLILEKYGLENATHYTLNPAIVTQRDDIFNPLMNELLRSKLRSIKDI